MKRRPQLPKLAPFFLVLSDTVQIFVTPRRWNACPSQVSPQLFVSSPRAMADRHAFIHLGEENHSQRAYKAITIAFNVLIRKLKVFQSQIIDLRDWEITIFQVSYFKKYFIHLIIIKLQFFSNFFCIVHF